MKQKFSLVRDDEKNTLIIKEYAELDKEILSLLCEESYSNDIIQSAMAQGEQGLITAIRTHNLYPPGIYAQRIVATVMEMYSENGNPSAELFFDDRELFAEGAQDALSSDLDEDVDSDDNNVEVDDLLEDELDDNFDEETNIVNNLKSSLKVSDDDTSNLDNTP
ncbi:MAG: hypothetical protein PVI90_09480 [Desulfobacteraceae bacterium]|jgi:hypothetical protein